MKKFNTELLKEISINKKNDHSGNWGVVSRGPEPEPYGNPTPSKSSAPFQDSQCSWRISYQEKLSYILRDLTRKFYAIREYHIKLRQYEGIGYLYDLLDDLCSKELLVKLFAFRTMSHRKIKLPQSNPKHWNNIKRIEQLKFVGLPLSIGL